MMLKRETSELKPLFLAYSVCHRKLSMLLEAFHIAGRQT